MKNNPIFQNLIKYGLYSGAILSGYLLLLYVFNLNFFMLSFIGFLLSAIVLVAFSLVGINNARSLLENFKISFLQAWLLSASVLLIGLFVQSVASFLINIVIDPDYFQKCIDEIIQMNIEYASQSSFMEQTIQGLYEIKENPTFLYIGLIVKYIIKSIIFGAIIALIAKRKNRLEETL